ncbi:hypothetical protein L2E82_37885 [Cichorium intybus]|uniref:Uncharacterized protein n=1 Tax=Cichorium intybus TaxID=13427 RepID=A0ACB9AFS6_CICIN|nr:hypothetical protein L2E82_37885 [Cichorium intybus]
MIGKVQENFLIKECTDNYIACYNSLFKVLVFKSRRTAKDLTNPPATSYLRRKNHRLYRHHLVVIRRIICVTMLPQRMKKAIMDNPKKLATLIDLVNLPSTLREFVGQSQSSRLGCFRRVWSYIKDNNLQDPKNKNIVHCDEKLKSILLGKTKVELDELPMLIKLHFPKNQK